MGFKLKLVFLDFHIEPGTNCTFDYVEVEQHSVEHAVVKKIGRFCGNTIPNSIETDSRYKLVVKFHSDPTIQMQGFRAMFSRER